MITLNSATIRFVTVFFVMTFGVLQGWSATSPFQDNQTQTDEVKSDQQNDSINEQTIYIPYDRLREVFERDGRGVFLPYDKFQQLWNEARKRQPESIDAAAPVGALITDIESTASLGQGIVNVDATLKIELLRKGWHRVPLRLSDAAIRSARIDGREARVVSTNDGENELLVEHDADVAKTIELKLSYAKALSKTRGQSNVSFQSPQAPVKRWIIRTGEDDIEVEIEPMFSDPELYALTPSSSPPDTRMWEALTDAIHVAYPGAAVLPSIVTGGTDARYFRQRGVPSYGAGLLSHEVSLPDFLNRFHGHNERIDIESLRLTTQLWLDVLDRLWVA